MCQKPYIPDGTVVVAGAHTHGAFKWGNIKSELDAIKANDNFRILMKNGQK